MPRKRTKTMAVDDYDAQGMGVWYKSQHDSSVVAHLPDLSQVGFGPNEEGWLTLCKATLTPPMHKVFQAIQCCGRCVRAYQRMSDGEKAKSCLK